MRKFSILRSALFLLLLLFILLADFLTPFSPLEQDVERRLEPPGRVNILGTDGFGRDQLSRIIVGAKNSLITAFLAIAFSSAVGISLGALSAQKGGVVDLVVQRLVDAALGVPLLVVCMVLVVSLQSSMISVSLALATAFIPQIARFTRMSLLPIVHLPFVEAARISGARGATLFFRHLWPNARHSIAAHLSTLFGVSIVAETSLSFLGLGVPPPIPSLGRMLREGAGLYLESAPWLSIFPGIAVAALVFAVTFVADEQLGRGVSPTEL